MKLANEHLDYLVVHARHARQESQEPPTWSALAELKRVATVPLIGNGDVTSRAEWERLVKETGCDGALIARAAIKSPWVFRELRGEGPALPSSDELSAASGAYFELARARGTKQKFLDWHEEGFRRIRARLEGRAVSTALPANEHMR
jgi:tRNA-dihydrouridine synthase